jgi:ribonuclease VapC
MILDSSAIVAIFEAEPEAETFLALILDAEQVGIAAASVLECGIVLSHRKGRNMQHALELFLAKVGAEELPFTEAHRREATRAWWRFGKTRHDAALNFGDCIAYATAKLAGRPLLCKGDDFPKTDLSLVAY